MGLLNDIKEEAKRSSAGKKNFFYVKDGNKRRVRFLQDLEDGFKIVFHSNYDANVEVPCQQEYGRKCDYCNDDSMKHKTMFVWSVWDYDSSSVQLLMYPMNRCSPVGSIVTAYETYGTLLDRDYTISCSGKGYEKTFSVMAMDKEKFRNQKAKPFTKKAAMEVIDKAYPDNLSKGNGDSDGGDGWEEDAMNEPKEDYASKKPKELYDMCVDRGIECEKKKPVAYYVNLLEEDDRAQDDWAEDEDDDEWEEE